MNERAAPFAKQLRRYRDRRCLTQEELAAACGLTARAIGALERGERRSPYPHTIGVLAAALGLSAMERQALVTAAHPRESGGILSERPGLPAAATVLLGRTHDLAATERLLYQPEVRLLTLTGPGGVGKTRLALQVATDAERRFDGVVMVPLASLAAPDQVLSTIARAIGLPDVAKGGVIESLTAALRDRETLLLLDNFEHLAPAAPFVSELLTRCKRLKVLATSRAALGSRFEREYSVLPLAVPPADKAASANDLRAFPSVQLFIERAQAVDPAFHPELPDLEAIAAICRHLDGLPLAIELAAARTRVLSPRIMLARLANHLDLLSDGPCDLPARQRTLRATIAWSHDLLTPAEQRAFRRLAIFVGGFTLEAAEYVGGSAPERSATPSVSVLDLVSALVSQSLLLRERESGDGFRFRMLETVREFGLERLDASGEDDEIHRRHAAWCLGLAERGDQALLGPDQQLWQDRLEVERGNVRAALAWLRGQDDVEPALRLGAAMVRFWWCYSHYGEGQKELEALLALPGAADSPWSAAAMTGLGLIAHKLGDAARTVPLHDAAIAAWRALDRPAGLVQALWGLGFALASVDPAAAEPIFAESLSRARDIDHHWFTAASHWGLGEVAHARGRRQRAAEHFAQALEFARRTGNPLGLAATLQSLGRLALENGNLAQAAAQFAEALSLFRDISVPWGIVRCLEGLAGVASVEGQPVSAAQLLAAASALRETIGLAYAPDDAAVYSRALAATQAHLGRAVFDRAWDTGHELSPAAAIDQALALAACLASSDQLKATKMRLSATG